MPASHVAACAVVRCDKMFDHAPEEGQRVWLFCEGPPEDPEVTCFLSDEVEWLDGKAPEGKPWVCSASPVIRNAPLDITGAHAEAEDSY